MKRNLNIVFLLLLIILGSCKEKTEYSDIIFFTGTESSSKITLTVDGPYSTGVTITSTAKAEQDVKIHLDITPESLVTYNAEHGTSYILPPKGSYSLSSNDVVLKAGSHVSEAVELFISSIDEFEEGKQYCIPLKIVNSDNDNLKILESSNTVYFAINKTTITKAVELKGRALHVPQFITDPRVGNMTTVTMECRFKVDNFSWINTIMGEEENFLMRCVDWDEDGNYNFEMGPITIGGQKLFHAAKSDLVAGQWYHVAIVCTGSKTCLYINGKLDSEYSGRSGAVNFNYEYDGGFHMGQSCGARYLNGAISEARLWNRALTQVEIQENMCYVSPTSEGLLAYWRCDHIQEDGTVRDETGNGFDAKADSGIGLLDNVRCPF